MSIILTPFAKLLLLFYDLTGSYGVSLILFGLVIRLILFPIFLKGRKGMLSMSGLAEKQKVLQQKYARDRVKYSQELQRLYEEEGVKPSSGCLWSFLPLPFLMVLYAIVRQPLTYLMNMTQDQFNVVSNLLYGNVLDYRNEQLRMAQDVFLNHDKIVAAVPELANMPQIDFTFLGVNLSQTPHFMFWKADDIGAAFGLWLIPVISAALGVVSMIVTNHINGKVLGTRRTMDQSTRMTMFIMPLFSLWICFTLPAALGVYWIANSLFAMLQEVLNIPFLRSFLKKQEEAKVKRREEEKERVKREKQAQAEAKKKAAEEMRRIQMERKLNKTIIFVTHDIEEAISLADVIIFMDKGEIAQIASPEEMLRNPANDLIRSFLGKHIHDNNETLTISSFLRTNIFKVGADRGILECTELMALHGVDTLLVTDSDDRYLGTVSIEEINEHSQEKLDSIAPLVRRVMPEASITDEAKACFDKLLVKGGNYVVVLNPDQTIAGIVTRSSMARALASAVWGD